jgi:hypothetical protein
VSKRKQRPRINAALLTEAFEIYVAGLTPEQRIELEIEPDDVLRKQQSFAYYSNELKNVPRETSEEK